jgi:hypothetical protein
VLPDAPETHPRLLIDPMRAIATCLKPSDSDEPGASMLRLWEVAGQSGPVTVGVRGYARAVETDLLERELRELPVRDNELAVDLKPHGLCALKLLP